ncbi:zinc finger protein CONSTANS-LIKE 2-like [Rutidosis leptorrhynchoides]|uniref:zinc finger protein CONSTANS-LIKE 2-like n=1 Tax=Rutidosis leptorrhynchoides TaxID=125765 RepID=UPI003A990C48
MLDHSSTLCLKTNTAWARVCDTCRSAPCTIYCRPDAAYLCTACDARIHAANKLQSSQHERVWVCEACEQAPAAFTCKADAASLCTTCDAEIHSVNPLARRHHRVPVMPIPSTLYGARANNPRSSVMGLVESHSGILSGTELGDECIDDEDESEAASWLLFDGPAAKTTQYESGKLENGFLFNGEGGDDDEYLEFMEFGGDDQQQCYNNNNNKLSEKMLGIGDHHHNNLHHHHADSVVPVQKNHHPLIHQNHDFQHQKFQLGMEYNEVSSNGGYGYPSLAHSVSMSSMEVGVVPDSTRTEPSLSNPIKGTLDIFSNPAVQVATQLSPMDREARVLRYREKKKNRKFEKTIRYASRKAYAETRPRIKGRFAKRTNADVDVDQMFPTNHMVERGYGVVPSF